MLCPLCSSSKTSFYSEDSKRQYHWCEICRLVFVPSEYFPSAEEEKNRYDAHQNSPLDLAYREHLQRIAGPLLEKLPNNATGLDFGCGPQPVLQDIFRSAGKEMDVYDSFYFPEKNVFENKYDFITATEVIEHLHHPYNELSRIINMIHSGGYLGVMTRLLPASLEEFKTWFYIRDFTHVCFYDEATLHWIARKFNLSLKVMDSDAFIFQKLPA